MSLAPDTVDRMLRRRRRHRGLGIRGRLVLFATCAVLGAMGAAGGLLLGAQADVAFDEGRDRAAALLESLAVPSAMAVAQGAIERLDDQLTEVARAAGPRMGLSFVAMLDVRGRVVAHSGAALFQGAADARIGGGHDLDPAFVARALASQRPLWRRDRAASDAGVLDLAMPAVSGLRWGTLVARFDLAPVARSAARTRLVLIFAAVLLTVAMIVGLSIGISRIVVRPIQILADTAGALQSGDLEARARVRTRDELGQLARGFNAMAEELQSYTSSLERRVQERSREVELKNEQLEAVNARLQDAVSELERLARLDGLTQVYNRRYFAEVLDFEVRRSARAEHRLTLIMLDVDHFKRLNDTFGHPAGDAVLRELAQILTASLRSTDIVARYGGEEFVVLMLDTPRAFGLELAERLRAAVARHDFTAAAGEAVGSVTVSVGVAAYPDDATDGDRLVSRADQALYAAKAAGRNAVVVWDPGIAPAGAC